MVNKMISLYVDHGTGPVRNPDITDAEFEDGLAQLKADNVQALWAAADTYVSAQISGAAFTLLAIGVMKGLPKSLAVSAWINSVWALYYQRKPSITSTWDEAMLDFSSCGQMPCTVPELLVEVNG